MGGLNSCYTKPRLRKHNYSATFTECASFNSPSNGYAVDQVNINTASPEELMTLPGVTRTVANNIVKYRAQINGFRRIEDMALVSGIGGDRLTQLRPEITVRSHSTTASPLVARVSPLRFSSVPPSPSRVALNTANVFRLMRVPGLNQRLAEAIVMYREKRGSFSSVDDLLRVKGVDTSVMALCRPYLMIEGSSNVQEKGGDFSHLSVTNGDGNVSLSTSKDETLSQFSRLNDLFTTSQIDLLVQLDPFKSLSGIGDEDDMNESSTHYQRPEIDELDDFAFERSGRLALRVGSWNLCRLTRDKAQNPGVREVVCLTLLERGISLLAVQEVAHPDALQIICDELNTPTLPNVKRWSRPRGTWTFVLSPVTGRMFRSSEYTAFLFDTDSPISIGTTSLLETPGSDYSGEKAFTRSPFMANCILGSLSLVLVTLHLKAAGLTGQDQKRTRNEVEQLSNLARALSQVMPTRTDALIAGDFNLNPNHQAFSCLRSQGYTNLIPDDHPTNVTEDGRGSRSYDNLWLPSVSTSCARFTGEWGVVREGLSHPLIPRDTFSWNGPVSDHCPVWAEFFID